MSAFTFEDLLELYKEYENRYGADTYKYMREVFARARTLHAEKSTAKDVEQSWKSFKGKAIEKLIVYILEEPVRLVGLRLIQGSILNRVNPPPPLDEIKRKLLIDYGQFGCHLPDADMVVYHPESLNVLAILSSKVTLRERIAQSGYWKLKLYSQNYTRHIKMYFVTPDEDDVFMKSGRASKPRAIAESELDGNYILNGNNITDSENIKPFPMLIADLEKLITSNLK